MTTPSLNMLLPPLPAGTAASGRIVDETPARRGGRVIDQILPHPPADYLWKHRPC